MLSLVDKMPWNYHVTLLGVTWNGPGSTMAQQLRRVLSSPLVPMELYTEVTLRVHRVEITSVLSGTLLLESRHSAGRYRLLLRVRSPFQYHWHKQLNRYKQTNQKNNKTQGCAFDGELEKKMNSSLSFGQAAVTFGLSKAISGLSKVYNYDFVRGWLGWNLQLSQL